MNENLAPSVDLPAILGGAPVRPEGPSDWPPDDPAIRDALEQCFADGSWGKYHGRCCADLTESLTVYHGCAHALLCSSGTVAVELALRGLKIGPGDEVILAGYDFKGNFQDLLIVGATPVLVDVRSDNWNLDVDQLENAISPTTKAILASHLHGGVVPMQGLMEFARAKGLAVIEDACQMPGAIIDGRKAGTWGDVGVLSFGGSKLLSAGRGGAVLTDTADIVQRIRLYTQRGNEAYPLSELQAAVLIPQLQQLDDNNARRSQNAQRLTEMLRSQRGLQPFHNPSTDSQPGYYKFGLQYDPAAFDGLPRDLFAAAMQAEGIALFPGFRSLHKIHSARRYRKVGDLPNATDADDRVLTLHHPVLLGNENELQQIIASVDKIRRHARMIVEQAKPV